MIDTASTSPTSITDGDLLASFHADGDQEAFERLARRHGPMIHTVAWRVLGDPHEAEDVTQAVLLILARKAGRLRRVRCLAAWLHHTARQVALDARQSRNRREARHGRLRARQTDAPHHEPASADAERRELAALLDEEIDALPVRLRLPVLLHHVEGLTQGEVAGRLGCSTGTLSWRLHAARKRLRGRLSRRKVAFSAGLLGAVAVGAGPAISQAALASAAQMTAAAAAAGSSAVVVGMSAHVVALAKGAGGSMFGLTAKSVAAATAVCALTASVMIATGGTDQYGDPLPRGAIQRLGSTKYQHGAYIEALDWSPDGKYLATCGRHDKALRVWDANTGAELFSEKFGDMARSVVFSADGRFMAASSTDGTARVWSVPSWEPVAKIKVPPSTCVAISSDGKYIGSAGGGGNRPAKGVIYEVATGKKVSTLKGMAPTYPKDRTDNPYGVAIHPNGKIAATVSIRKARLHDLQTGEILGEFPGGWVAKLDFSPDGKYLAYTARSMVGLKVVDVAERKVVYSFGMLGGNMPQNWHCVKFSPDSKLLAAGNLGGQVAVWRADDPETLKEGPVVIDAASSNVGGVAFSPESDKLAVGSWSGKIRMFDPRTGQAQPVSGDHPAPVASIQYSPDGQTIATGHEDGSVHLWKAIAGTHLARLTGPARTVSRMRFSADGQRLVSLHTGGNVATWSVPERTLISQTVDPNDPARSISASDIRFLPGTEHVMLARHGVRPLSMMENVKAHSLIEIYDGATGQLLGGLPAWPKDDTTTPQMTRINPQGLLAVARLVDASQERFTAAELRQVPLTVWEVATGKVVDVLDIHEQPIMSIDWGPHGRRLTVGGLNRALVYDFVTGEQTQIDRALRGEVALGAAGQLVALGSNPPAVYDLGGKKVLMDAAGNPGWAKAVALSPDGRRLAASTEDSSVLIWSVPPAATIDQPGRPGSEPDADRISQAVAQLDAEDPAQAYAAAWFLAGAGNAALEALSLTLEPAGRVDEERLAEVRQQTREAMKHLDDRSVSEREQAAARIAGFAQDPSKRIRDTLIEVVQGELEKDLPPQIGVYLHQMVRKARTPLVGQDDAVHAGRALYAIELIGTEEALAALERLTVGDADAQLTRQATGAVARLRAARAARAAREAGEEAEQNEPVEVTAVGD